MDFKRLLKVGILLAVSILISNAYAAKAPHALVCEQTYALCTSAACIPDPSNPKKSICDCVVEQGKSVGFSTCNKRKPYIDQHHATHVISTFSYEQFDSKKSLNCPQGKPWSNCVDMPCTVDPRNPSHAICRCEISTAQAFFTFGGNCETKTCETGFWSGATKGAASNALRDALNMADTKPVTPTSCSTDAAN